MTTPNRVLGPCEVSQANKIETVSNDNPVVQARLLAGRQQLCNTRLDGYRSLQPTRTATSECQNTKSTSAQAHDLVAHRRAQHKDMRLISAVHVCVWAVQLGQEACLSGILLALVVTSAVLASTQSAMTHVNLLHIERSGAAGSAAAAVYIPECCEQSRRRERALQLVLSANSSHGLPSHAAAKQAGTVLCSARYVGSDLAVAQAAIRSIHGQHTRMISMMQASDASISNIPYLRHVKRAVVAQQ